MKPMGYWTKEKCHEEALKYKVKKDFKYYSPTAYVKSCEKKWINEICTHMKALGNRSSKCIYACEFPDNHVYVGLTYNIENRKYRHLTNNKSSVYIHQNKTNLDPVFKKLTDYINVDIAIIKEADYVEKYKNNGWVVLNKVKTGSIGGNVIKWTKEKCQEEALKYNNKTDFINNTSTAYNKACKQKWLDDICSHMIERKKPRGYWTKEKCREEISKYEHMINFILNGSTAYNICLKNKWVGELCSHLKRKRKPKLSH